MGRIGRSLNCIISDDGQLHEVSPHLWAATNTPCLFDNGGVLAVRNDHLAVPAGNTEVAGSALVLVNEADLRAVLVAIAEGGARVPSAAAATTSQQQKIDQRRTGLPGRPTIKHLIVQELRRRVAAGTFEGTLDAEAQALAEWAKAAYSEAPPPTWKTIRNQIRATYNTLVKCTK